MNIAYPIRTSNQHFSSSITQLYIYTHLRAPIQIDTFSIAFSVVSKASFDEIQKHQNSHYSNLELGKPSTDFKPETVVY